MLDADQLADNLLLCRPWLPPGDLVECGCWRGGTSAAIAETLPGRRSMLFDSFEGLPEPGNLDGVVAREFLDLGDRLAAPEGQARDAMARSGSTNYNIIKGWFSDTLPKYAAEQPTIAVLRLDGDWYDSTMTALTYLFPFVAPGGIVIIDDYEDWEGCRRAVHDYLAAERRPEAIRRTRRRQVAFLAVQR